MQLFQALHVLSEDSLLAAMPEPISKKLKTGATVRAIRRGATVVRQGQAADKLIIPVDGALRLVTRGPTGSATYQLRARRALNLGELLVGGQWAYSAFAETDLHVLEIDGGTFRQAIREAPTFARYLQRITRVPSVRAAAHELRQAGL